MQTELQTTVFNYEILDCEYVDRVFLKGKEEVIKSRTAQTVIENGRDLLEAKERVGHGNFMKWVEGAFPWSWRTAKNMMNVAETFKIENFSILKIQDSALYALAAPSTPEAARAEALELAEAGEKITHRQAQELIQAHKDIEAKNQQLADMHAQIKKLEIRLPTDETVAEINRLKAELDNLKKNPVQVVKEVIKKVQVAPPDYIDLKNAKMNLGIEKSDLEIEKAELQKKIKELQNQQSQYVSLFNEKAQDSERHKENAEKLERDLKVSQQQLSLLAEKQRTLIKTEEQQKVEQRKKDALGLLHDAAGLILRANALVMDPYKAIFTNELITSQLHVIKKHISDFEKQINTLEANEIYDI